MGRTAHGGAPGNWLSQAPPPGPKSLRGQTSSRASRHLTPLHLFGGRGAPLPAARGVRGASAHPGHQKSKRDASAHCSWPIDKGAPVRNQGLWEGALCPPHRASRCLVRGRRPRHQGAQLRTPCLPCAVAHRWPFEPPPEPAYPQHAFAWLHVWPDTCPLSCGTLGWIFRSMATQP